MGGWLRKVLALAAFVAPVGALVALPSPALAATFTVTTLADSGSGSLRQAIADANAATGADTIVVQSGLTGTITLLSDLPELAGDLTVSGPGESSLTIDGAATYRPFWVRQGISFTISNITLKRGKNTYERGALIHNQQGTVTATDVTFRDDRGHAAVYSLSGTSVATYTDCSFINNTVGIGGDHGTTPTSVSNVEADYTNRTYVVNSLFDGNSYAISQERFTKITGSTFRNNGYGAYIRGLNRTQILNSTFEDNSTAIAHSNWTPTTWTVGANNRYINGNTFTRNSVAMNLGDSWNDGHQSQRWSTITNNTWDGNGTWIQANEWNGSTNASIVKTSVNSVGEAWTESGNVVSLAVTTTVAPPVAPAPVVETTTTTTTSTTVAPVSPTVVGVLPLVQTEELPSTGGSRPSVFMGLGLLVLAVSVLVARKRVLG